MGTSRSTVEGISSVNTGKVLKVILKHSNLLIYILTTVVDQLLFSMSYHHPLTSHLKLGFGHVSFINGTRH